MEHTRKKLFSINRHIRIRWRTNKGMYNCECWNVSDGLSTYAMSLNIVLPICETLFSKPAYFHQYWENQIVKSLEFADCVDRRSSLQVDIFIGSDYYWLLGSSELVKKGSCAKESTGLLTAIHTKLGWLLFGLVLASDHTQILASHVTTHMLRVDAQQ